MSVITQRGRARRNALQSAIKAQFPTIWPKPPRLPTIADRSAIALGRAPGGGPILLPARARLEHAHVIGTTGGGKTKFIEHCVRQDIANGSGVLVVDPHGEHEGSLYRSLVAWCETRGYSKTRTIHLIDPNAASHTIGFNPLARPDEVTDLSVIAGVTLEAFSRAWGGEDTTNKPTIERMLTATFTALAELGLTLAEAPLLYDRSDRYGLRAWALAHIRDRYAREELHRLHELSLDEKRRHDFDLEVIGPINRLARFVRPAAIRAIVGQTENVLNLRDALDAGHIILVNLSGGQHVYERDADLLGRLLTRFLFFHAKRRRAPERPFFVYLDECHRYLSGDLENILAEVRKFGVAVMLSTQWLAQLQSEGDNMLAAVRSATNLKVVFRLKDPVEAEEMAHMVVPLDLEMPVKGLVKPTVIAHRLTRLSSESISEQRSSSTTRSETDGTSYTEGTSHVQSYAETVGESHSSSETDMSSEASATAQMGQLAAATGMSSSQMMTPATNVFGTPIITGMSDGMSSASSASAGWASNSSRGSSSAVSQGTSSMHAETYGEAWGHSTARSVQRATSVGHGKTRAHGRTIGTSEAFEPLMADLPSAMHGKENVLYMAAQTLRTLKTGTAFVNYVDQKGMHATLLSVPRISDCALSAMSFSALRDEILVRSPSAMCSLAAREAVERREQLLIEAARTAEIDREPVAPADFRTKRKRVAKRT